MTRRWFWLAVAALCIFTVARVASTHGVFSPTWDEPAHVAGGWEYLRQHTYRFDTQHPPLSRILFAFPFRHASTTTQDGTWIGDIFQYAGTYMKGIRTARRGNLPFVVIGIIGVALWANELLGRKGALVASVLFAMMPPVLAHGGLATTDMAGASAFPLAMYAVHRWLDNPTWRRTLFLGVVIGYGLVTKMSFPLFFAIGAVVMLIAKRRLPIVKGVVAHALAFLVVWVVYRAHYDTLVSIDGNAPKRAEMFLGSPWIAEGIRLPAPEFFNGLLVVKDHDRDGHEAYFLGEVRKTGWWYYFPVVLGVKTPLPMLILAIAGTWLAIRQKQHRHVAVIALLMLGSAMTSNINLGIRHLLPIYAPLSILAAFAMVTLWQSRARWPVAALCTWLVAGSLLAHPDYLPWMNALAGPQPYRVVVDSNYDWGQDVLRLARECRKRGIKELHVLLFGTVEYPRVGMPRTKPAEPYTAEPGWYALSESEIVPAQVRDPVAFFWLTSSYRYERVGKSIRLYYVP